MQLRLLKNILLPSFTSLVWSSNNGKLAAITTNKVVYLLGDNGDQKDKFKTKPADAQSTTNYIVRAMAFSPDSTKVAMPQSNNMVFIY
eukprot:gene10439-8391_t